MDDTMWPIWFLYSTWYQKPHVPPPFDPSSYYLTPVMLLWSPRLHLTLINQTYPMVTSLRGSLNLSWPPCPHLTPTNPQWVFEVFTQSWLTCVLIWPQLTSFNPTVTSLRGSLDLSWCPCPYLTPVNLQWLLWGVHLISVDPHVLIWPQHDLSEAFP